MVVDTNERLIREVDQAFMHYSDAWIRDAKEEFSKHIETINQTVVKLNDAFDSGEPFSFIRVSDTDSLLLFWLRSEWQEQRELFRKLLFWSGLKDFSEDNAHELSQLMTTSTFVGVQEPFNILSFSFWGPLFVYLKEGNLLKQRHWNSLHSIYALFASGDFGKHMRGKKVVVLGGKAEIFRDYFYKNQHWNQEFPELGFQDIEVVAFIPTPDLPESSFNARHEIEQAVRNTYKLKPDAYLLSSGMLAKFLAVQVRNEAGAIGLDIGNTLESIMNLQCKRPFMERYGDYTHPTHDFVFEDYYRVRPVKKKSKI